MNANAGSVLIGHAQRRLSEGLRDLLQSSFEGVFMVADRPSLIEGASRLRPVLIVFDLSLAAGDLHALVADLHRESPDSRTLLLSDHVDPLVDTAMLSAGADGVVHHVSLAAEIPIAVDAVMAGRRYTSPSGAH
jgi:DNA-binding NarL/FixJ family response regulator